MILGHSIALDPTEAQAAHFRRACGTCGGSGRIMGRVEHTRFTSIARTDSSSSWGPEVPCWVDGNYVRCPTCHPNLYGRVTHVEVRAVLRKTEGT